MGDMEAATSGEWQLCNNPGCARTFADHERRIRDIEKDETISELRATINKLALQFENMRGRLAGYMFAGGLVGTIVGAMAAVLASKHL